MATIQTSSDWESRRTVQKGNLGEDIVKKFLEGKGLVVYKPVTDKAHSFDMLAICDKRAVMIAEVKSKTLMNFSKCTGFNYSTFLDYCYISNKHKIPVFVFFVDEKLAEIYGNWLHELEKPAEHEGRRFPYNMTTRWGQELRLYHYNSMRHIADIAKEEAELLKNLTYSSYG